MLLSEILQHLRVPSPELPRLLISSYVLQYKYESNNNVCVNYLFHPIVSFSCPASFTATPAHLFFTRQSVHTTRREPPWKDRPMICLICDPPLILFIIPLFTYLACFCCCIYCSCFFSFYLLLFICSLLSTSLFEAVQPHPSLYFVFFLFCLPFSLSSSFSAFVRQ